MGYYAGDEEDLGEIECPNCGTRVYSEVLTCPNCGLHFHVDELTGEGEPETVPSRAISAGALLVGWLASAVLAFLINWFASRIWPGRSPALPGQVILFLAGPLGAFAGGYLAARIAERREMLHGFIVSCLSLISAVLLEAYWHDLASEPLRPLALASWAVMLLAGPLGGWLLARSASQARVLMLFGRLPVQNRPARDEKQLYFDLLSRVRHDINVAERLIAYEQRRAPRASRATLIQNAIDRLNRDKR